MRQERAKRNSQGDFMHDGFELDEEEYIRETVAEIERRQVRS